MAQGIMSKDFADKVASLCLEKFKSLPSKGKPMAGKEWTLLAGVVQSSSSSPVQLKVVSLGSGTKCIGASKLCGKGTVINDSHAEVLARRGLLRYFLHQIKLVRKGYPSIFVSKSDDPLKRRSDLHTCERLLTLRPDVAFHFFASHTPCGDASIFPKDDRSDDDHGLPGKRTFPDDDDDWVGSDVKKHKIDDDIHRTGAKCLSDETKQDPRLPGSGYHAVGAVRTKPGRGDRTFSVSCSDKLLRWQSSGIQGAMLSLTIEPVYLSSLTVGGGCPYSERALRRAVIDRGASDDICGLRPAVIRLLRSTLEFEHAKHHRKAVAGVHKPCPSSVIWWEGDDDNNVILTVVGYHEVLVNGRKQGVTKKMAEKLSSASALCKKSLLDAFKCLWDDKNNEHPCAMMTYAQIKSKATSYQRRWLVFKNRLGCWTEKPKGLLEFT